jgi:hypothetical protein
VVNHDDLQWFLLLHKPETYLLRSLNKGIPAFVSDTGWRVLKYTPGNELFASVFDSSAKHMSSWPPM